jgi:hypothetical protein
VLAALLGGCTMPGFHLIDQRTFEATTAPSAADIARAKLPALPLAVIRFDQPDVDYKQALADAIGSAQTRKSDVAFDVVSPVPLKAPQAEQDRATAQGKQDAQDIATAIAEDGVAPDHIFLGFRGDPGAPPREVRVYVR